MEYKFSAIAPGAVIAFNPAADVLFFNQGSLHAADTTVSRARGGVLIEVAGKEFTLANTRLEELTTTNIQFLDGSELIVGDNTLNIRRDALANLIQSSAPGEDKHDHFIGLDGADQMEGGRGNDVIKGGSSPAGTRDRIFGEEGDDRIDGGNGDDLIFGGEGNDRIHGSTSKAGNDVVFAGFHDDIVSYANAKSSTQQRLYGGEGNDTLTGGRGSDRIHGGVGRDEMLGGRGNDTFLFDGPGDSSVVEGTADVIAGFSSVGASSGLPDNDSIDYLVAGADANYTEGAIQGGGYGAAFVEGTRLLQNFDQVKQYVFVTDGQNGYLFADIDRDLTIEFSVILPGLTSLTNFAPEDII